VHPPSNGVYRRRRNGRLDPGTPATPGTTRLGLLPFGPDPVHACSAAAGPGRQRRPIPVLTRYTLTLGREFGPASRGFRVQGTPSAPPSTVTRMVATVPNTEPEAPQKVAIWSLPARSPAEPGPERPAAERQKWRSVNRARSGLCGRGHFAEPWPERPAAERQGAEKMALRK